MDNLIKSPFGEKSRELENILGDTIIPISNGRSQNNYMCLPSVADGYFSATLPAKNPADNFSLSYLNEDAAADGHNKISAIEQLTSGIYANLSAIASYVAEASIKPEARKGILNRALNEARSSHAHWQRGMNIICGNIHPQDYEAPGQKQNVTDNPIYATAFHNINGYYLKIYGYLELGTDASMVVLHSIIGDARKFCCDLIDASDYNLGSNKESIISRKI